ncbi:hypothetical protein AMECASPLE_034669 [Ameca splendens]|uniref:Uncharacterized protein n=1 Tax=Ameca splendens TaxID=208324 RepID=A0ABV1AEI9_9TELE
MQLLLDGMIFPPALHQAGAQIREEHHGFSIEGNRLTLFPGYQSDCTKNFIPILVLQRANMNGSGAFPCWVKCGGPMRSLNHRGNGKMLLPSAVTPSVSISLAEK